MNNGSGWTANNGTSGAYNVPVVFGPFPINATPTSIVFTDNANPTCTDQLTVTPPPTCSDQCAITAVLNGPVQCNNNNTPFNPNDDTYSFTINISGINTSNGWTATLGGVVVGAGAYPANLLVGPLPIGNGQPVMVVVTDNGDPSCFATVMVTPPSTCSNLCQLTPVLTSGPVCNNNGTPGNPNDDVFFFTVNVGGSNTGSTWRATIGGLVVASGQPYGPYQFGPFPISGGAVAIMFTDEQNNNCFAPLTVNPPDDCSDQCLVNIELNQPGGIACYNNGTPYDPTDDVYYVILNISGFNTSGLWVSNEPGYTTPTPFGTYAFGPYPISGGNRTIHVRDASDPNCKASIFVQAPPTCSSECLIDAMIGQPVCNDNGTPSDPSDDTFTVPVTMVGIHNFSPLGWRQVFPNVTFGIQ